MKETLKELSHELDHEYGGINLRFEALKNINKELGQIAVKVENTDKSDLTSMALTLHDIDHKVVLLADLLHYVVNDLGEDLEKLEGIKESYFDLFVREKENTPDSKNQG